MKAIVMGASSGIGKEVARQLVAAGWTVGVAARREEALLALKAEAPECIEVAAIDVTQADAGEQLKAFIQRLGGIDLYFHIAGVGWQNRQLEEDVEMRTVETNAVGFMRMVGTVYRYFAGRSKEQNASYFHIAAITSIAGTKGLGPAPAYSATKSLQAKYLEALEQLANQQGLRIRFTDIRPGFVDTALLSGTFKYPMMMQPEKVARDAVKAVLRHRSVRIIDARYRVMTFFWRLIPRWAWRRLKL